MRIRMLAATLLLIGSPIGVPTTRFPAWWGESAWQTAVMRQPAAVSLVIANGIVITVDGGRRILIPGSLAINGTDIVAVDTPANIAARDRKSTRLNSSHLVISY